MRIEAFSGDGVFDEYRSFFNELKSRRVNSSILKQGVLPDSLFGVGFFKSKRSDAVINNLEHFVEGFGYFLFPKAMHKDEVASSLKDNVLLYDSTLVALSSYLGKIKEIKRGPFSFFGAGFTVDAKFIKKDGEISFSYKSSPVVKSKDVQGKLDFYLLYESDLSKLNKYAKGGAVLL